MVAPEAREVKLGAAYDPHSRCSSSPRGMQTVPQTLTSSKTKMNLASGRQEYSRTFEEILQQFTVAVDVGLAANVWEVEDDAVECVSGFNKLRVMHHVQDRSINTM